MCICVRLFYPTEFHIVDLIKWWQAFDLSSVQYLSLDDSWLMLWVWLFVAFQQPLFTKSLHLK